MYWEHLCFAKSIFFVIVLSPKSELYNTRAEHAQRQNTDAPMQNTDSPHLFNQICSDFFHFLDA